MIQITLIKVGRRINLLNQKLSSFLCLILIFSVQPKRKIFISAEEKNKYVEEY